MVLGSLACGAARGPRFVQSLLALPLTIVSILWDPIGPFLSAYTMQDLNDVLAVVNADLPPDKKARSTPCRTTGSCAPPRKIDR
jgi:hypothetical protein